VQGATSVWQGVEGDKFSLAYPTTLWQQGEIIKDEWVWVVPADTPPGDYEIRMGIFDPLSGERLSVKTIGPSPQAQGDWVYINKMSILPATP
jgi:hypothetical protein